MNPNVYVDRRVLARVDAWIARQHANGVYQPTAVSVVESPRKAVLLVKSVKDNWWSFPQGDVRKGEGVVGALFRNLEEKTGIPAAQVGVRRFVHATRFLMPGMELGKNYFYFDMSIDTVPKMLLQDGVVSDYRWLGPLEAAQFLYLQGRNCAEQTHNTLRARGTAI